VLADTERWIEKHLIFQRGREVTEAT
jgi:hypothetical protein